MLENNNRYSPVISTIFSFHFLSLVILGDVHVRFALSFFFYLYNSLLSATAERHCNNSITILAIALRFVIFDFQIVPGAVCCQRYILSILFSANQSVSRATFTFVLYIAQCYVIDADNARAKRSGQIVIIRVVRTFNRVTTLF